MRKIINFTHATLDGYIDDPQDWSFEYSNEELQGSLMAMHLAADALLLGRITFEGMAQSWPAMGGNPFADHVNAITHYVVASQPVDTTVWDPTVVIPGDRLVEDVSQLKQADGADILIWGTGRLTDDLLPPACSTSTGSRPSRSSRAAANRSSDPPAPAPSNSSTPRSSTPEQ